MKTRQISTLLLLGILTFSSCKKEEIKKEEEQVVEEVEEESDPEPEVIPQFNVALFCNNHNTIQIDYDILEGSDFALHEQGICYSSTESPDIGDNVIDEVSSVMSSGTNNWPVYEIADLSNGTTYHIRGYVKVGEEIYYSTDLTVTTDAEAPERYIGEEYQGGIIAGMKCDGSHGVIVAPAHYLWASTHLDALEACEDLDYGGKTDWGLANLTQLREVYRNLHLTGIESFHNGYYWSTTYAGSEIVDYYYYIHFVSGTEDYTAAYNELRPCPARTF